MHLTLLKCVHSDWNWPSVFIHKHQKGKLKFLIVLNISHLLSQKKKKVGLSLVNEVRNHMLTSAITKGDYRLV